MNTLATAKGCMFWWAVPEPALAVVPETRCVWSTLLAVVLNVPPSAVYPAPVAIGATPFRHPSVTACVCVVDWPPLVILTV